MKTKFFLTVFASVFLISSYGQSLDEIAHNRIWEKYQTFLGKGFDSTTQVHVMAVPIPITWTNDQEADAYRDFYRLVSVIPPRSFTIDPEFTSDKRVDSQYELIMRSFQMKATDPAKQEKLDKVYARYSENAKNLSEEENKVFFDYDKYIERIKNRGDRMTYKKTLEFDIKNEPRLSTHRRKLRNNFRKILDLEPRDEGMIQALQKFHSAISSFRVNDPVMPYEGSFLMLKSIDIECKEDSWSKVSFTSNVSSKNIEQKSWNVGGSWGGSFFNAGGGVSGTSYKEVISSDDEFFEISFCNVAPLPVGPGNWYDETFLQAIDNGDYQLKPNASFEYSGVFGKDGAIPRKITGFIVAKQMKLTGKINKKYYKLFKETIKAKAKTKWGFIKVSGGGSKSVFSEDKNNKEGEFEFVTNTKEPIIIAIITNETK